VSDQMNSNVRVQSDTGIFSCSTKSFHVRYMFLFYLIFRS